MVDFSYPETDEAFERNANRFLDKLTLMLKKQGVKQHGLMLGGDL
jgi:hypothetical protein